MQNKLLKYTKRTVHSTYIKAKELLKLTYNNVKKNILTRNCYILNLRIKLEKKIKEV